MSTLAWAVFAPDGKIVLDHIRYLEGRAWCDLDCCWASVKAALQADGYTVRQVVISEWIPEKEIKSPAPDWCYAFGV